MYVAGRCEEVASGHVQGHEGQSGSRDGGDHCVQQSGFDVHPSQESDSDSRLLRGATSQDSEEVRMRGERRDSLQLCETGSSGILGRTPEGGGAGL